MMLKSGLSKWSCVETTKLQNESCEPLLSKDCAFGFVTATEFCQVSDSNWSFLHDASLATLVDVSFSKRKGRDLLMMSVSATIGISMSINGSPNTTTSTRSCQLLWLSWQLPQSRSTTAWKNLWLRGSISVLKGHKKMAALDILAKLVKKCNKPKTPR